MASAQVQRESKAHEAGQGGIMQGRIGGAGRAKDFGVSIAPPSISATDMHPSPNVWKIEIRCFVIDIYLIGYQSVIFVIDI